ncbi:hypothetical protein R7E51_08655 [Vibrio sp. Vb1166]|uniref:hypothetical protein n=1 Tax=Vibrio TaxID=662 RepID=UPI001A90AAC2|nr:MULTISPECIES: hypothetical protein [Vibrio]MBO0203974.1 hypothetical protein [Vibrio alginolyticus]MBS9921171.1 hypothetical protein [Vibrio alginolyticus]MDW1860639.1 hypothetical protein [Vibrio sp. Vb1166]
MEKNSNTLEKKIQKLVDLRAKLLEKIEEFKLFIGEDVFNSETIPSDLADWDREEARVKLKDTVSQLNVEINHLRKNENYVHVLEHLVEELSQAEKDACHDIEVKVERIEQQLALLQLEIASTSRRNFSIYSAIMSVITTVLAYMAYIQRDIPPVLYAPIVILSLALIVKFIFDKKKIKKLNRKKHKLFNVLNKLSSLSMKLNKMDETSMLVKERADSVRVHINKVREVVYHQLSLVTGLLEQFTEDSDKGGYDEQL